MTDFYKCLRALMRPTTLHNYVKFGVIRFTGYGVIAEKPRVGHLPRIFYVHPVGKTMLDRKMIVTF